MTPPEEQTASPEMLSLIECVTDAMFLPRSLNWPEGSPKYRQLIAAIAALESTVTALRAENESRRKDKERLDWIEREAWHGRGFVGTSHYPGAPLTTAREFIDAALSGTEEAP